jgi:NTE family protein
LNEVSFNAVLLKELRMIAVLRQVANPGNSEGAQWAGMRIHRVASEMLTELGASFQAQRGMGILFSAAR